MIYTVTATYDADAIVGQEEAILEWAAERDVTIDVHDGLAEVVIDLDSETSSFAAHVAATCIAGACDGRPWPWRIDSVLTEREAAVAAVGGGSDVTS